MRTIFICCTYRAQGKNIRKQSFVEEVQIHEEENERGQFLKSISFRFPVYYNGKEIRKIEPGEEGLKKYADELTKENLEGWDKEKTDETVVLLTRAEGTTSES